MKSQLVVVFCFAAQFVSRSHADELFEPGCPQDSKKEATIFSTVSSNDDSMFVDDSDESDGLRVDDSSHWYSKNDDAAADDSSRFSRAKLASFKAISFDSLVAKNVTSDTNRSGRVVPSSALGIDTDGWNPLDTLSLFGGLEGSKQPQDFGVNANFGSRWAANWGFPLLAEYGIGAQIGSSVNQTDNAVQVFERVGASTERTQSYSTAGVFQRYGNWRWGMGYDFLYESYFDNFFLGQWRGRAGYAVTEKDEIGTWFTIAQHHASGMFLTIPVTLTPLDQGSIYWQHQFEAGTRTMVWAGIAEGHGQVNLALGDLKKTNDVFVFGAEIDVPLNRYLAIYGQANFLSPAASGTVDSYLGIAFYPGGHAFPVSRSPFAPLLALANSTMFATDLHR